MLSDEVLKKCLAGKSFRTNQAIEEQDSEGKPVMVNGKPKAKYVPHVRKMTPGDVLNSYETDEQYVVISKDGSKYRLEKGEDEKKGRGKKPETDNPNPNSPPPK